MNKPNIIMIMTDTQATNMVGCYSGQPVGTENIDGLAAKGVMFGSAYTTCPVCTPARSALFTGIYSSQSGAWTNNVALGQNMRTMGAYFKEAGYRTVYIGKWHLDGHDYYGTGICPDEWDKNFWYEGANYLAEKTEQEISLWRNGLNSAEDLRANHIDADFTWAQGISKRAKAFLEEARATPEQPYLLVLSYDEPHHPFHLSARIRRTLRELCLSARAKGRRYAGKQTRTPAPVGRSHANAGWRGWHVPPSALLRM